MPIKIKFCRNSGMGGTVVGEAFLGEVEVKFHL